jgi:hypothetical protein
MVAVYPGGVEGLGTLTHKDLSPALKVAKDHGIRLRITE